MIALDKLSRAGVVIVSILNGYCGLTGRPLTKNHLSSIRQEMVVVGIRLIPLKGCRRRKTQDTRLRTQDKAPDK